MEKETEKKGSRLVNVISGAVFSAAAFLVSGCDYMVGYSSYDPFYPGAYYNFGIVDYPGCYHYNHPSYRYPRYINPPRHRYLPSPRPPIVRPSPPHIRPSPPSIRSFPQIRPPTQSPRQNMPRQNSPQRDRNKR